MSRFHHKDIPLLILSVDGQLRGVRGTSSIGEYEPSREAVHFAQHGGNTAEGATQVAVSRVVANDMLSCGLPNVRKPSGANQEAIAEEAEERGGGNDEGRRV